MASKTSRGRSERSERDTILNINLIKKETPNPEKLKVTLRKDKVKGNSVFATKPIKKGNIVAYYKMIVGKYSDPDPYKGVYLFTVYTKDDRESKTLVGNIYPGSVPPPSRNIPYWGFFANEPSGKQLAANVVFDQNLTSNYRKRNKVVVGDTIIYKLIATRDIKPGEEILVCYGDNYERGYKANC